MKPIKSTENHLDAREPRWFAVYTRFKSEKRVQKRLLEQGIQAYLPVQQLTRRFQRSTRRVELPLISCYVFTRITKFQYVQVLNTPGVLRFVRFSQNLVAIRIGKCNGSSALPETAGPWKPGQLAGRQAMKLK